MPATVSLLKQTTFAQLVAERFDVPVRIHITRAEYQALSDDDQFTHKNGPYVLAVSMKDGETHRRDEHAEHLNLICLDVDDPKYARDFFESPAETLEALYPFNAVLHVTATHTPEKPRVRVIVDVDAPIERHKDAVAYVVSMLGIPANFKGARESNVLSQPFFFPAAFFGEDDSPVLASRTNGRTLIGDDIPVRPVDEDRRTYAYQGTEASDLAFLPVQDLTVEDIREPLMAIDPDITYGPWTMVASSLRHQFRDEDQAHEAYQLFDEWSRNGTKYKGENDTWAKWKSFKPDPTGKNPRTIRTLFHYAQEAGWLPTKIATKMKLSIGEWIDQCEDADKLLDEGKKLIADLPFKSHATEELLIEHLRSRYRKLTKRSVSAKSLKRDVSDARFKAKAEAQSDDKPKWMRAWCYVTTENMFRNVLTGEKLVPAAFNYAFSSELMPTDGELAKTGKPTMLPTDAALNVRKIKKVGGVTYDPRRSASSDLEPFFTHNGIEYLNEYRASSLPKLDPANAEKVGKYFVKHLRTLIAEREYADLLLYFFAFLVQYPGEKLGWCPVIQSAQGAGKSLLLEIIGAALGHVNVTMVNPATMKQGWNDWSFGYQLVGLEEIKVVGHARAEIMNSIKDIMTNEKVTVNRRHTDAKADLNLANFIGFTNYPDALYLEPDDRRYMFIRSALDCKAKVEKLNAENYFEPLKAIKRDGGGALRSFLLGVEIPDSFPRRGPAPYTIYRGEAIAESKPRIVQDIEDLIAGDNRMISADIIHGNEICSAIPVRDGSHGVPHYLSQMNYIRYNHGARYDIHGDKTVIWVHRDGYDEILGGADDILRERFSPEL